MSVLYFLIADKQLQKNIGYYVNDNLISDEALEEIKQKAAELLSLETAIDKSKRYKSELQHTFLFYYLTLPSTLYISAVTKGSFFTLKDNLIFELIEDVDSQGIRKLVDKQGNLIKVALQNLRYSIDKYQSFQKDNTGNDNAIFDHNSSEASSSALSQNKEIEERSIINTDLVADPVIRDIPETAFQSLKEDITIPKKSFWFNKKIYRCIGVVFILMLFSIIIVYKT